MSDVTLKRIIDLETQSEVDSSVYTIIDSPTGMGKKYPLGDLVGEVTDLKQDLSELDDYFAATNLADGVTYTGYYYVDYRNGANKAGESYKASGYVDISGCNKIVYTRLYVTSSVAYAGIAFYDENKTFIENSGISAVFKADYDHFVLKSADVPSGAKYIRCTTKRTGVLASTPIEVYDYDTYYNTIPKQLENTERVANKVNQLTVDSTETQYPSAKGVYDFVTGGGINYQAFAIDDVLCIGDSLTAGSSYRANGSWIGNIKQCYPYFLSRFLRCDVVNGGDGGESVKSWYSKNFGQYDYTTFNTIIIFLGTNGGLTDTLETDVDPYESYEDYADTNTGTYCKMVEEIKAANPNCQIIMVNIFSVAEGSSDTKTVLRKIAEKYALPIVETLELATATSPQYHGAPGNVHLSKMGYCYLAHKILSVITEWISADVTRGDFGRNQRNSDPDT